MALKEQTQVNILNYIQLPLLTFEKHRKGPVCILTMVLMVNLWICLSFCPASSDEIKLRHVETDVLIPKMLREKAKELCAEKVEGVIYKQQKKMSNFNYIYQSI